MKYFRSCLPLAVILFAAGLTAQTATTTTATASPTSAAVLSPVTLSATVKGGTGNPGGQVTFLDGTTTVGTATLASANTTTPSTETLAQAGITVNSTAAGTFVSADLNGDGKADLLSYSATAFEVFLSNGNGGFTTKPVQAYALNQPAFLDVNGDGKMDIATLREESIAYFAGDGAGTFMGPVSLPSITPQLPPVSLAGLPTNQFTALAAVDLGAPGGRSLLVGERLFDSNLYSGGETGVISVYNKVSGAFALAGSYPGESGSIMYPRSVVEISSGDITGDASRMSSEQSTRGPRLDSLHLRFSRRRAMEHFCQLAQPLPQNNLAWRCMVTATSPAFCGRSLVTLRIAAKVTLPLCHLRLPTPPPHRSHCFQETMMERSVPKSILPR